MLKTKRSSRLAQLKTIKQILRKWPHENWLRRVVEEHIDYYGVPFNSRAQTRFVEEVKRLWLKSLKLQNNLEKLQ